MRTLRRLLQSRTRSLTTGSARATQAHGPRAVKTVGGVRSEMLQSPSSTVHSRGANARAPAVRQANSGAKERRTSPPPLCWAEANSHATTRNVSIVQVPTRALTTATRTALTFNNNNARASSIGIQSGSQTRGPIDLGGNSSNARPISIRMRNASQTLGPDNNVRSASQTRGPVNLRSASQNRSAIDLAGVVPSCSGSQFQTSTRFIGFALTPNCRSGAPLRE